MKYLKIQNAGSMDRRYLYFLGSGDKRGLVSNSYVIGHKGTGLKLAIIGALKLGLRLIISSVDQFGPYKMIPKIRPFKLGDEEFNQIIYVYMRQKPLPWWKKLWYRLFYTREAVEELNKIESMVETPYTIEAFKDWTTPIGADDKKTFKTVREPIANAHDADVDWKKSYVDETCIRYATPGETVVYLETTDEIETMLSPEEISRYLKIFEGCPPPIHCTNFGAIYPKSEPEKTRLFVRGVVNAVLKDSIDTTCFDYSIFDNDVQSEEKEIKDLGLYMRYVGELIKTITDINLATTILEQVAQGTAQFENRAVDWNNNSPPPPEAVRAAFYNAWIQSPAFGPHMVFMIGKTEFDYRALQMNYALAPFGFSTDFRDFLRACGISTSFDVVPKQGQMDFLPADESELDPERLATYMLARKLLCQYFPGAIKFPIKLIKSKPGGNLKNICGVAGELDTNFKEIWLNISHQWFSELRSLLMIMIHEYLHCEFKAKDFTPLFEEAMVASIVAVIFKSEIEHGRHVPPRLVDPKLLLDKK